MVKRKRENLLGKLDKLRAAGDPEKARLGATKEYLEGMQIVKKAKLHQNPDLQLEEEKVDENAVLEVQRKIASNKLHFGDKELVRALKIAQKSEVQKNSKKISALESGEELKGRGSKDVTVESLQSEIDMLNKMELEQLAKIVAIRTLQKVYTGEDKKTPQWLPEWFLDESSDRMAEFKTFREAATREEINLHTRMTAQKGVRTAVEQYTKRLDKALGDIDEKEVKRDAAEKRERAVEKGDKKADKKEGKIEKPKDEKTKTEKTKAEKTKAEKTKAEKTKTETDEYGQEKLANMDVSDAESDDGFFENSAAQFSDDDEETFPQMSMATGYISGSDDEDIDNDKVVKGATKKERKNRRGQAARQRIWELKYGSQANHLKKQRQERYEKSQQLQREWEEREAKRQERRNKMSQEERDAEDERQRRKKLGLRPEPKQHRDDSGPLHPSWQAKKAQSNVSFAGKKVVFGEDTSSAAPAKPKGPAKDDEGPLHPSWAAKKAQSASTAFAGKKMTF